MAKVKTLYKEISVLPYQVDLWLLISSDPSEALTKLNHANPGLAIKWSPDMAAWTEDKFYKHSYLPVIFDAAYLDQNTIAHESVHIKNRVFEHAGILHDAKNDEPEAYLLAWIVGEITKAVSEYKNNKLGKNGK